CRPQRGGDRHRARAVDAHGTARMGPRARMARGAGRAVIDRDRLRTGGALGGALVRGLLAGAPAPRELEPGDAIGPFRIVRELSRGGMAIVYLAERADGEFEQRVALKWMAVAGNRSAAEELFRRERQTLAGLEHPGIARLVDGGR